MTYEEMKDYLSECCKNNVPISYDSLKKELTENSADITRNELPDITRRWRRSNYCFYNKPGKKALYRFQDVFMMELQKTNHNSEKYVLTVYIAPTDETNKEIHVLGVTKYPWSYDMKEINKEQMKNFARKIEPNKTVTYRR